VGPDTPVVKVAPLTLGLLLLLLADVARAEEPEDLSHVSLEELMEMKVTVPTRTPISVKDAPAAIYVVTEEQIRQRGYRTLVEALEDLPGFDIIHTNGIFPDLVHQRGLPGNNQRTLVYIDGILQDNIFELAALGQAIRYPLANVKRIEVLAGPASALYGSNAFNGVINVITKNGADDPGYHLDATAGFFYTSRRVGYGAGATGALRGTLGSDRNKVAYSLSGYFFKTEGPSFAGIERLDASGVGAFWSPQYDNSHEQTYNVTGKISWRGLRVEVIAWDYLQGQGTFANGNQQVDSSRNGAVGSSWDFRGDALMIGYLANFGHHLSLDSELTGRHTAILPSSHDAYRNNPGREPAYARPDDLVFEDRWTRSDYSIELKERLQWQPGERYTTLVGAEGVYYDVPADYARSNPMGLRHPYGNVAAYVQQFWRPVPLLAITGGYRFDYSTLYGPSHSPRIGAILSLKHDVTLKVLFGTGFRGPTPWELFSSTATRIPNPGLKPEQLVSGEAGLGFRVAQHLRMSTQIYFNQMTKVIINDLPTTMERAPGQFFNQNQNIGDAQVFGIEAQADLRILSNLSAQLDYTFNWGRYTNLLPGLQPLVAVHDGGEIPNIAHHHVSAVVTLQVTANLSFNLRLNYVGERDTIATNPLRGVPSYTVFYLNVLWQNAFVRGLYFDLYLRNFLNELAFDPGIRDAKGTYYPTEHPIAPLNAWLTAGYRM
jgi:outer membrane receptor for ferrienterochelin and colicins